MKKSHLQHIIKEEIENLVKENGKHQLWNKISILINQHINDKQIAEQLLGLIDDYGIESYGEGSDDANLPEFY